jgi:hypothetical protein
MRERGDDHGLTLTERRDDIANGDSIDDPRNDDQTRATFRPAEDWMLDRQVPELSGYRAHQRSAVSGFGLKYLNTDIVLSHIPTGRRNTKVPKPSAAYPTSGISDAAGICASNNFCETWL